MRQLFKDVPTGNILSFLRQVNLFYAMPAVRTGRCSSKYGPPPLLGPDSNPVLVDILVHPINAIHGLIIGVDNKWLRDPKPLSFLSGPSSCILEGLNTKLIGNNIDYVVVIPPHNYQLIVSTIGIIVRTPIGFQHGSYRL